MSGPTDLGSAGGEGVGSGVARVEPAASTPTLNSRPSVLPAGSTGAAATASVDPYHPGEFDALIASVWALEGADDPTRFDELLTAALAFIGAIAIDGVPPRLTTPHRAAALLRAMEQRALWGPDHPVRQP